MADDNQIPGAVGGGDVPGLVEDGEDYFKVARNDGSIVTLPKATHSYLYNQMKASGMNGVEDPGVGMGPPDLLHQQGAMAGGYDPLAGTGITDQTVTPGQTPDGTPSLLAAPGPINMPEVFSTPGDDSAVLSGVQAPGTSGKQWRDKYGILHEGVEGDPNGPASRALTGGGPMAGVGGLMPTQTTEVSTQQTSMGPTARAAYDNVHKADNAVLQTSKDALVHQAKMTYDAAERQTGLLRAQESIATANRVAADTAIEKMRKEVDDLQKDYNNSPIDSNRLFGDGQTSNKILAGIGLALGALGSGFAGKDYTSQVVAILDKAIQRDINVQKMNLDKKGKAVDQKRGALHDFMEVTKDRRVAEEAEFARQYQRVAKEIDMYMSNASNAAPGIKAKLAEIQAQIRERDFEHVSQYDKIVVDTKQQLAQKQMKSVPEGHIEKFSRMAKDLAVYDRIEELANDVQTGYLQGNWQNLKARFGLQNASEAELQKLVDSHYAMLVEDLAKSRGFAPTELPFFGKLTFNRNMNPDTFREAVRSARAETLGAVSMLPQQYGPGTYIPDVISMSEHYKKTMNDSLKSSLWADEHVKKAPK